jgi:hypothetical protein
MQFHMLFTKCELELFKTTKTTAKMGGPKLTLAV